MTRLPGMISILVVAASCTKRVEPLPSSESTRQAAATLSKYAKKWPTACKKIKERLRSPGAGMRSRQLPARAAKADAWTISLGPFSVSLPADRYIVKAARPGNPGDSLSIFLRAAEHMVVLIKTPPSQPMKDIFAQVDQPAPEEEEEKHTLKLFGTFPTIHDLEKIGYKHSPADLDCIANKADQEIPIAISLILKASGQWAEKVFKIEDLPGFVFFGNQGNRCTVEARPYDKTADYFVTYTTSDRKRCEETLGRFRLMKGGGDNGPPWLEALGKAIRSPEESARWESLQKTLASDNAPAESLDSITKIIEQIKGPR